MSLFVDTSVWSLALRRDAPASCPEVQALAHALEQGQPVLITGLVLQELLQGFSGPKARANIIEHLAALPLVVPERRDHIEAADLRNRCRRAGIRIGTIDALLAQLCIRHDLTLLSTDADLARVARHEKLRLWSARPGARAH